MFCGWVLAFIILKAFSGTISTSFNLRDLDICASLHVVRWLFEQITIFGKFIKFVVRLSAWRRSGSACLYFCRRWRWSVFSVPSGSYGIDAGPCVGRIWVVTLSMSSLAAGLGCEFDLNSGMWRCQPPQLSFGLLRLSGPGRRALTTPVASARFSAHSWVKTAPDYKTGPQSLNSGRLMRTSISGGESRRRLSSR